MFTGVFLDAILELIAFLGIVLGVTIAAIGVIFMVSIIIFMIKTAAQALKATDDLEEETDEEV